MEHVVTTPGTYRDGERDDSVWVTVGELARIKGVKHPAISKRLKRLAADGLIEVRKEGRATKVRLAEWDHVTGERSDPSRTLSPSSDDAVDDAPASTDPSYAKEAAREKRYKAELAEMEVRRRRGELCEVALVGRRAAEASEVLVRAIDHLSTAADDLATAFSRNGVSGLRAALKSKAAEIRTLVADSMSQIVESDGDQDTK